jgi:pyruvate carboxylase subunit B
VTPVSQFYFQQAFNNVMFGPWQKIAEGYGLMVLGYYGRTPVEPDPEIVKIAAEQLKREPTRQTPQELNDKDPEKGLDAARRLLQAAGIAETDENLFIAATCKEKGITFLKGEAKVMVRKNLTKPAAKTADADQPATYSVSVGGRRYTVLIEDGKATVNGKVYDVDIAEGGEVHTVPGGKEQAATSDAKSVKAPMPGSIVRVTCKEGDNVHANDTMFVIEAMKMEVEVKAPQAGTVSSIAVSPGSQVTAGHVLAYLN